MYVDLNPVRVTIAESPTRWLTPSLSTGSKRAKANRSTPPPLTCSRYRRSRPAGGLATPRSTRLAGNARPRNAGPTGRRVRRDGLRGSDRMILNVSLLNYLRLLHWTAKPSISRLASEILAELARLFGIEASMWWDLMRNWRRHFGRSLCVGRPESMCAEAERTGHRYHRGQASAAGCFT